jgi:membrane protein YqaA with SNARE-associated domain
VRDLKRTGVALSGWRAYSAVLWAAIERFAHARGAIPATFLWNFAQGSVVPGPAELVFAPLALAEPKRAWPLAFAAMAGSILGGCVAYWLGVAAFASIGKPLLRFIGVSDATLAQAIAMMAKHGWMFIVISTLTPISAKAVSIGAGAAGMAFPVFAMALGVGRVLRFSIDVLLLQFGREAVTRLVSRALRR